MYFSSNPIWVLRPKLIVSASNNFGIETAIVTGYNNLITPYVRGTYDLGKTRIFIAPGIETKDIGIVLGIEIMLK